MVKNASEYIKDHIFELRQKVGNTKTQRNVSHLFPKPLSLILGSFRLDYEYEIEYEYDFSILIFRLQIITTHTHFIL